MALRITTLSDNAVLLRAGLLAEHGLSLLLEADGRRVLLDTGQTISAVHNAQILGISLDAVDQIVLSHGHFDHTGGLREVLRRRSSPVEVIGHPDIWAPKYAVRAGQPVRFVGLPHRREELEALGATFRLSREPVWLSERVVTTGEVRRRTDFEPPERGLRLKVGEDFPPDPLLDDGGLVVRTDEGLVVLAGCSHAGLINTLLQAREVAGDERIRVVIGGTHLVMAEEAQVRRTAELLRELGVERLGVSHCTGPKASAYFAREFGDQFFYNNVGTMTEV